MLSSGQNSSVSCRTPPGCMVGTVSSFTLSMPLSAEERGTAHAMLSLSQPVVEPGTGNQDNATKKPYNSEGMPGGLLAVGMWSVVGQPTGDTVESGIFCDVHALLATPASSLL